MNKTNYKITLILIALIGLGNLNAQTPSKSEMIANKDWSSEAAQAISENEKAIGAYYLAQNFLINYERDLKAYMNPEEKDKDYVKQLMDVKVLTHTEFAIKYQLDEEAFNSFLDDTSLVVNVLTYIFEAERDAKKKTH
jgi:hypothetical protein